ncbi:MAG TPA: aldo/keto reductase [Pirellulales bacterium]|jgi:aryl-alcohol dehydrogenase-like predicted oxidoreductase|nr:aldo/keto reductase [Pirellulales bacterium]
MQQRNFGGSGVTVSEIGVGTWQFGGDWGAEVSDDEALAILAASVDEGVTFFDTADIYGLGRSESLIGRFLKQSRMADKIFVATKLGRGPTPGWPDNFKTAMIRKHAEASLKRLGVEALDLEQLHCVPAGELRRGEVFEALRALKREGKIKQFGASVESMDEALICLEQPDLGALQIIFNIFRQKPISTIFERAKRQGVAIIVRLPLASGLLSGKFTRRTKFDARDHRNYNRDGEKFNVGETFAGLPFEKGVELTDALKPLVPNGMTLPQMALRWCLDFDAVSVLIPGAKNALQARENAASSDLPPLSPDLHKRLRTWYDRQVAEHIRGAY